jgi:hypothetical protein
MRAARILSVLGGLAIAAAASAQSASPAAYDAAGKLLFPKDYRTWVYLSSGVGMAYVEGGGGAAQAFDNVFVDPAAYAAFQKTGTWPDKTVLVLEIRSGEAHASIDKSGRSQGEVRGLEAHVKDTARFKSGWAFFPLNGSTQSAGPAFAQDSTCNACHEQHAAVDTTFVQFYPTLLPLATRTGRLSAAYLAEEKANAAAK